MAKTTRYRATMTMATYRATVRKMHLAYAGLVAAMETAEFSAAMEVGYAMDAMRRVPGALRVQVCKKCSPAGYHDKPGDPYTSVTCQHPDVPRYDIRTGVVSSDS